MRNRQMLGVLPAAIVSSSGAPSGPILLRLGPLILAQSNLIRGPTGRKSNRLEWRRKFVGAFWPAGRCPGRRRNQLEFKF